MEFIETFAAAVGSLYDEVSVVEAVLSLLLAFVFGQLAAWAYVYTHAGLSYSRAFVQALVLLAVIVAFAMLVIRNSGANVMIAFGLIGALTVIRFRNILKDTRDAAFIFFSIVTGMATGTGSHILAFLGTIAFCTTVLYLHWTQFGTRRTGDAFLRFQTHPGEPPRDELEHVLTHYCVTTNLISQRFQDDAPGELAYRLTLRDPATADKLVTELRDVHGISNVTFVLHEEEAEV